MPEKIIVPASCVPLTTYKTCIRFSSHQVVINRPCMDAGLLQQTKEFNHANGTKISGGDAVKIKEALNPVTLDGSSAAETARKRINAASHSLLPSWAVALIVANNLHIICSSNSTFDFNEVKDIQKGLDSGGSIFASAAPNPYLQRNTVPLQRFNARTISCQSRSQRLRFAGWVSRVWPGDVAIWGFHLLHLLLLSLPLLALLATAYSHFRILPLF